MFVTEVYCMVVSSSRDNLTDIRGWFKDAARSSLYVKQNGGMNGEYLIGKNVEGSDQFLIRGNSEFAWRHERNYENSQSGQ
jgi:hypothetical protein